ncbi:hypothetical protein [Gordonia soli]|nr:hypothetical protein [Gordonia soli]
MMEGSGGRPAPGEHIGGPLDGHNLRRRRSAWNPASWSAGSWSPTSWSPASASLAPNRGYRAPGTPGGRRFAPTEHLAPEAVAAFVDGELGMTAHARAADHLAICTECIAAVDAQVAARARLRTSGGISMPAGLLGALSQIPTREIDISGSTAAETDRIPERRSGRGFPVVRPSAPDQSAPNFSSTRDRMNRWRGR